MPRRRLRSTDHEPPAADSRPAKRHLWLALYFPRFPLEALCTRADSASPVAVVSGEGARCAVVAASGRAEAQGVRRGMAASAACALVPRLVLLRRDETAEGAALEGLAAWAGGFTSLVSLVPPQGLLLEVGGSLALFGGLETLLTRVSEGVGALGYDARPGVAPTPLGAWLLARAGFAEPVTAPQDLPGRLAPVPLECLELDEPVLGALRDVGLERFGDCCRLPRDGAARRTDPGLLSCLDRALGRRPDPRPPYAPPAIFERRATLSFEARDAPSLLNVAHRLLLELEGFLVARAGGARSLEVYLSHRRGPATRLVVELVTPTRDARHLLVLLRERLARVELAQAVLYVGLRVHDIAPLAPRNHDLYGARHGPGGDWRALVERLRSRLGVSAVQGLALSAEHRPERAWRCCAPSQASPRLDFPARPLWLLDPPEALDTVGGRPWLAGPLELADGPERIESGWWDGHDVARDYFVARHSRGARYWIYRELRDARGWYLHGIFA